MSNSEIGTLVLTLSVLLAVIHSFGFVAEKLKQPRLIGEIIAGVVLGPSILGQLAPDLSMRLFGSAPADSNKIQIVLQFIYWIGLLLLMFISGAETRRLMAKENRRETAWLFGLGTTLPFAIVIVLGLASVIPLPAIMGTLESPPAAILILAIATAVTSIPVISKIFLDLKIIHTRFASLILSFAVLEDIALWGVLAFATAIAHNNYSGPEFTFQVSKHVVVALCFIIFGLWIAPSLLKRLNALRINLLFKSSRVGYLFFILFLYSSIASALDVNLVFAAFLAGFGIVGGMSGSEREKFSAPIDSIAKVAGGIFIPIYFAMVGHKLLFGLDFSLNYFLVFLVGSSIIAMVSFGIASYCAGFRGRDVLNLTITKNARGGPGIVLASVAYDAGIINGSFYTTLVLTAILTSQVAGFWLRHILSRGMPLLSSHPEETWLKKSN